LQTSLEIQCVVDRDATARIHRVAAVPLIWIVFTDLRIQPRDLPFRNGDADQAAGKALRDREALVLRRLRESPVVFLSGDVAMPDDEQCLVTRSTRGEVDRRR
jgi:hypothetical protein